MNINWGHSALQVEKNISMLFENEFCSNQTLPGMVQEVFICNEDIKNDSRGKVQFIINIDQVRKFSLLKNDKICK